MIVDTNVLLDHPELISSEEKIIIPMRVLEELDHLKTKRVASREVIRQLIKNRPNVEILSDDLDKKVADNEILNEIIQACSNKEGLMNEVFYTNDYAMYLKAQTVGLATEMYKDRRSEYNDPYYAYLNDDEVNLLYSDIGKLTFPVKDKNRKYNYIFCYNNGLLLDILKYNHEEEKYEILKEFQNFESDYFGRIKPKDEYQKCLFDSLVHDDITLITGPAGSGKTVISLAYIMYAIQSGKYDKFVVFTNPVKAKDTHDLGFYPGTKNEKLLSNSIGNILSTKFGDRLVVESLMERGLLSIQPFSDIRGMEIKPNEIMYVTEMQNSSISLAKLALQRAADGAKVIFEGDINTQVDLISFEDSNNGLKRCIEILSGYKGISHIKLESIYRSRIAELAEML